MNGLLETLVNSFLQAGSIEFLINLLCKGSLILFLAAIVNSFLQRSSAAVRHWVWCLAFGGLLLLLPLSFIMPQKPVRILPELGSIALQGNTPKTSAPRAEMPRSPVQRPAVLPGDGIGQPKNVQAGSVGLETQAAPPAPSGTISGSS